MGNLHRKKLKHRRKGRRMAEEAWDAVEQSDLARAEKTLRNALKGREGDCVLWNDLGLVLWQKGELREAEKMFRAAILIRPDYEDGKVNLSGLLAARGFHRQALRIVADLARHSPRADIYLKLAAEYRRLAEKRSEQGDLETGAENVSSGED